MKRLSVVAALIILAALTFLVMRPPRFWLNWTKAVNPTAQVGAQRVESYNCRNCHMIDGAGALKGPALDGLIARQMEGDPELRLARRWLRDPRSVKGSTAMPNFHLSDSEIDAILAYLATVNPQDSGAHSSRD